jgi:hypothetical protein
MTLPHPYGCRCAGCTAKIAVALLDTGRAAAARSLLEALPDAIVEELGQSWARGHDQAVPARQQRSPARHQGGGR